jgi:hypothetical protein
VTEVTPDPSNAIEAIVVTDAGRRSSFSLRQNPKRRPGIFVRSDDASKVTLDNSKHKQKTSSPRFETEEGTVKEVKWKQFASDKELIV